MERKKEPGSEITLLLGRWQAGDHAAQEELWAILYPELETLVSRALGSGGRTALQTMDLLNEACLHLLGRPDLAWPSRGHFFAFAAKVMRRVLIDQARRRQSAKRKGEILLDTPAEQIADPKAGHAFDALEVDRAITRLTELNPRTGGLVELRFFGGLSVGEAARALGISKATAVREWRAARAWLYGQLLSSSDGRQGSEALTVSHPEQ